MEPKLPPLPLNLDHTPSHLTLPIKAGELVRLMRQWGREAYALGQGAQTPAPGGVWIDSSGRAFGKVSDEQIEVVLGEALADVRRRSGLSPHFIYHQVPVTTYLAPDGETRWPAYSHEQRQEYALAAVRASLTPTAPQAASQQAGATFENPGHKGCYCGGWTDDTGDFHNSGCPEPAPQAATTASEQCVDGHDYQVSNARTGEQSCTLCGKEWGGFAPPAREDDR